MTYDDRDVLALSSGDERAFAKCVRVETPRLLALAHRIHSMAPSDALQLAWLEVWKARDGLHTVDAFRALSWVCTRRAAMTLRYRYYRSPESAGRSEYRDTADRGEMLLATRPTLAGIEYAPELPKQPDEILELRELLDAVSTALETLPESQARSFVLDVQGNIAADRARLSEAHESTETWRLRKARAQIDFAAVCPDYAAEWRPVTRPDLRITSTCSGCGETGHTIRTCGLTNEDRERRWNKSVSGRKVAKK